MKLGAIFKYDLVVYCQQRNEEVKDAIFVDGKFEFLI